MKSFIASVFFLMLVSFTPVKSGPGSVYVCMSSSSSRYHIDRNCRGLGKCSHEIKAMDVAVAEQMGKTPCHICMR